MTEHELELFKKVTHTLAVEMSVYYLPEELRRREDLGDLLHQLNLVILDYEDHEDPYVVDMIRQVFGVNSSLMN